MKTWIVLLWLQVIFTNTVWAQEVDATAVESAGPVVVTDDVSLIELTHVNLVFTREGDVFRITQSLRLSSPEGHLFEATGGYPLPLPSGAEAPRILDDNEQRYRIDEERIYYLAPIGPGGSKVNIGFNLPIKNGSVVSVQKFAGPIHSAQVISVWTSGRTRLTGEQFGEASQAELQNGMLGLVIESAGIDHGRLAIQLTGIDPIRGRVMHWSTSIATLLLFSFGIAAWIRRKFERGTGLVPLDKSKNEEC